MSKPLYIAEKPELGRAIVNAVGINPKTKNGYVECDNMTVTWCFGHLLEVKQPHEINPEYKKWDINHLPLKLLPLPLRPNPKSAAQLQTIGRLIPHFNVIVNAGDADQEGQRLVDEVLEYFQYDGYVERVLISDFNKESVIKAVQQQKPNSEFYPISMMAKARSNFDYIYGMNLSRVCTLVGQAAGYDGVLSVGRVQTAIIGLVVVRYRANKNHVKEPFYEIYAVCNFNGQEYRFKFAPTKQIVDKYPTMFDEKNRINNEGFAKQLANIFEQCGSLEIKTLEHKTAKVQPPLLFSLMNLQREANRVLNLTPEETLNITQKLREKHQLITYNRTDCCYLPTEHHKDAPGLLNVIGRLLPEFSAVIPHTNPSQKSKAFNDKKIEAHHAISPTLTSKTDLSELKDIEKQVYLLICRRYLAQFLPYCEQAKSNVELVMNNCFVFKANSTNETIPGWKSIFRLQGDDVNNHDDDNEEDNHKNGNLTQLSKGQVLSLSSTQTRQGFTTPPAIYTMDTLMADMNDAGKYVHNPRLKEILLERDKDSAQNGGIGTPATQASILAGLFKHNFLKMSKKQVIPTSVGEDFFDALPSFATQVDLTAYWQEKMNLIGKGKITIEQFDDQVDQFVTKAVFDIKENGLKIKSAERVHYKCPKCGNKLRFHSKFKFWSCSTYPECDAKYPDVAKRPDFNAKPKAPAKKSDLICPKCNEHNLVIRTNSRGDWYGCSGYPNCKAAFKMEDDKLVEMEFKKKATKARKTSTKK
ncbi:TPA: DNA topoisomerase [Photobacterium damselae]